MLETKEILDYYIYPNIDLAEAVKDLSPQDKGRYYLINCPECKHREAFIYKGSRVIKCNRKDKCSFSQSLWEYIQSKEKLSNLDTLKELARLAHYNLPSLRGYSDETARESQARASLMETALDFFNVQLWTTAGGKRVLAYLKDRGYSEEEIRDMELGYYPHPEDLQDYLLNKGYSVNIIKNNGLKTKGFGKTHILAIPYRDPVGRIKGFIVRSLLSDDKLKGEGKYKYSFGVEKDTLFNLHEARGEKTLIIVEGYLDALIATRKGVRGVVATGGSSITEAQLDNAIRYGTKQIILALDNDKAGEAGTDRSIDLITRKGLKSFVVTLPKGYKDPDEVIKNKGIEEFKRLLDIATSGAKWKAKGILSKHSQTDRGKQDAIDEAIAYAETLKDPIDIKYFLDTVAEELNIPLELLKPLLQDYQERKTNERIDKGLSELWQSGAKLLEEGRASDLLELVKDKLAELRANSLIRNIQVYELKDLQNDILQTREGFKTGYTELDSFIRIPQEAITIIAGRPSHGKTTLLLNLCFNMIKEYRDKTFLYFSYEENKKQLALKFINIFSQTIIDEKQNLIQIERYLRGNNTTNIEIEKGKAQYQNLTETGRLILIDEPYFVDELDDTIAYLSERYDLGAVFIDYIQKIKIKGRYQTRQIEIQKVSERILEIAKSLRLPIILGAQLGRDTLHKDKVRLDNLREAGDIEQDANLVLGLYNESMEKAQDEGKPLDSEEVDLKLTILKNRNGIVNEDVMLNFNRPLLTIKDKR